MRWSVGLEAEAGRLMSHEEILELADAVAMSSGIATGIGTDRYGAQLVVVADSREEAIEKGTEEFKQAAAGGAPAVSDRADRGRERGRGPGRLRMIRLGSLAGYPFEGPRLLGGWTAPAEAAVYAIAYKPEPDAKPDRYAVIYVDHSDNLSDERFPFKHPRASCWVKSGRRPVEGVHLHLHRAGRRAVAPGADRPRADGHLPPELQLAAVRPIVEGRMDRRVRRPHDSPAHDEPRPRRVPTAQERRRPGFRCVLLKARPVPDRVMQAGTAPPGGRSAGGRSSRSSGTGVTPTTMPSAIP